MDELDALQRQLAEVQANTPCASAKLFRKAAW